MKTVNCTKCGKEFSDQAENCPNCCASVKNKAFILFQKKSGMEKSKISGFGIAALILCIIGCTFWFGVILAIVDLARKDGKKKTCSVIALVISALWIILFIAIPSPPESNSKNTNQTELVKVEEESEQEVKEIEIEKEEESEEEAGVVGVEVKKSKEEQYGSIEDFRYELSGDTIILKNYKGKAEILEIKASYIIDGTEYKTDLLDFQVGMGNRKVKTLILCDGITNVKNSIFNSTDVEKVYFPKSMSVVHDNTLSYLHPDDGKTIKIYYGGTQDEWEAIFAEYKRTLVEDAEFGEKMGKAAADKLNEMMGMEYDSSQFEYFFSASPDDLK